MNYSFGVYGDLMVTRWPTPSSMPGSVPRTAWSMDRVQRAGARHRITLDPFTGAVNFTPNLVGNYIVVVQVEVRRQRPVDAAR